MRAILANPRYTRRQVWNRQRTDHDLLDPENTSLGHRDVMRWNTPEDWVISAKPAHPALVSEADFVTVQHLHAPRESVPKRTYLLAGLLRCGVCERLMESCWTHGRPAYRCRHGHTSATRPDPDRPPNAYVREDQVLLHLPALVIRLSAEQDGRLSPPTATRAVTPADAVAHVRAEQVSLTFDPAAQTLTADTPRGERITIG
ncbi:recombinase zinc beta ribbon domain-containing protein [Streptomyces sp. 6N223]|uniref:recombinase zinc beta ribbon domain-containing protein n=1 Tax=Streptomyces sp. 6N223 TaxID=3457412 RepID=UPI003FD4EAD0